MPARSNQRSRMKSIVNQWLSNGCCENHVELFLISHKRCFRDIGILCGIPEVGARSRAKLKVFFVGGVFTGSVDVEVSTSD